jgi:hypothetical protein
MRSTALYLVEHTVDLNMQLALESGPSPVRRQEVIRQHVVDDTDRPPKI